MCICSHWDMEIPFLISLQAEVGKTLAGVKEALQEVSVLRETVERLEQQQQQLLKALTKRTTDKWVPSASSSHLHRKGKREGKKMEGLGGSGREREGCAEEDGVQEETRSRGSNHGKSFRRRKSFRVAALKLSDVKK